MAVPSAPDGCWAAYTLPAQAPLLNKQPRGPFHQESGRLLGPPAGACQRLVPDDGGPAPFVLMVWEPGWAGQVGCRHGGSEVWLVASPDAPWPDGVKVKHYAWDPSASLPPTSNRPCPGQ